MLTMQRTMVMAWVVALAALLGPATGEAKAQAFGFSVGGYPGGGFSFGYARPGLAYPYGAPVAPYGYGYAAPVVPAAPLIVPGRILPPPVVVAPPVVRYGYGYPFGGYRYGPRPYYGYRRW